MFPRIQLARQALDQNAAVLNRCVNVEETEFAIVLRGAVRSYYHKQLAQQAVMPVVGGKRVVNEVVVEHA